MNRNAITVAIVGFFLLVGLLGAITVLAPGPAADTDAMSAANQLYGAGHYAEATRIYEQLVAQGTKDSSLFYNLANAYYRQGDLGRAVLNFQRAARLAPRDGDIKANLELARAQAIEMFPKEAAGPLHSLGQLTGRWLSLNETALLAVSLWFCLGFLVFGWLKMDQGALRRGVQYAMTFGGALLILAGLSLGSRVYVENTQPDAVIIADAVALSSEPGYEHKTEFSLHGGTEVKLAETDGDWIRLAWPAGAMQGWIPVEAVETIGHQSGRM